MEVTVTLYTKPGCHLCEPVAKAISGAAKLRSFRFDTRNIPNDPLAYAHYQHAIPVVTVNDVEIARHKMTVDQLLQAIDRVSA